MITRIEIDGFKSFADFALDVPPFLVLIGTNASGKSNLLDALRFVAAHARGDVYDAVDAVRGDAVGLFRQRGDGSRADEMTFALELVLDPDRVWDMPDQPLRRALGSRWRYELRVSMGDNGPRSMETFLPMSRADDRWPEQAHADPRWVAGRIGYLDHGDDLIRAMLGESRSLRIVSSLARYSLSDPTRSDSDRGAEAVLRNAVVQAVWRTLGEISAFQIEDHALRKVSPLPGRPFLQPNGEGLPAYLLHLRRETAREDDPDGVLAEIRADLVRIVREVTSFDVVEDHERRDVRVVFTGRYVPRFGADVASDGTLRILALLALLNDPARSGLVAIEEPENGAFPERLRELLTTMRSLATDPSRDDPEWPLKQVLVTSHSPVVLDVVPRSNVVFLENVTRIQDGVTSRVTVARRLAEPGGAPVRADDGPPPVTESEIERFRAGREPITS
ncbi:AAA family ATPase [Microtetraspora niveoalba]|uniref:AAA family ATPase n=1 Tax=Microtetraspora niveoalba TaxID=46175 RepID=UPI00082FBB2B|nr:AAA family ATPase [Microtetraspora niveoalba]